MLENQAKALKINWGFIIRKYGALTEIEIDNGIASIEQLKKNKRNKR